MALAYLGLGSNLGDRTALLRFGLDEIRRLPGTTISAVSPLYQSAPWGVLDQPAFYNAAASIKTDLAPHDLLNALKNIERAAGRTTGRRWGPRPLDIDILLYEGAQIDSPDLTIPHPRMWERRFVLEPLRDIWPDDSAPGGGSWDERLAAVADQPVELVAADWLDAAR